MTQPPNILLFISDQQRTDTMSAYGNDWIRSPHLNALAARSFVFANTYCTQPVCTPARASLMTGLYPHTHGCVVNNIGLRSDTRSIAEMLPATYRTAHIGKWHLGDDAFPQHGFDEWVSVEDHRRARYTRPGAPFSDHYRWLVEHGFEPRSSIAATGESHFGPGQRAALPADRQMGAFVAEHAESFVRRQAAEEPQRPWLLVCTTYEPHPPYTGPNDDLYDPAALPVGPAFRRYPEGHSAFATTRAEHFPTAVVDGHDLSDEDGWRRLRAQYFGNVRIIDDAVGRIVAALDEAGQAERTVVAFTSDHGEMAGDHNMLEKRVLYEESARVPFLLRVPWLGTESVEIDGVCSHVDLLPTLLDLAGADVPAPLPGRSLVGTLTGDRDLTTEEVFLEWNGVGVAQPGGYLHDVPGATVHDRNLGSPAINAASARAWRSVVTGDRWKLNLCADDRGELFDLRGDPHELTNLHDDPAHGERVRTLAARVHTWQHRTSDTAPLPEL